MFAWLLNFLPIASTIAKYLENRANVQLEEYKAGTKADTEIALSQIKADIETRKTVAIMRKAQQESLWTAWMVPTAFGVSLLHYGAVVLDSTFKFGWKVFSLPPPYDSMEQNIILSIIGVSGATAIVKRFTK